MGTTKIILAMVILIMAGCASVNKQRSRAEKFYREHPNELAEKCAGTFVPTFRQGTEVEIRKDTLYLPGDTIKCPEITDPATGLKSVPTVICPGQKTVYISTLRVDTIESPATLARIEVQNSGLYDLRAELKISNDERDKAEKKAKKYMHLFIISALISALYVSLRIFKKVP